MKALRQDRIGRYELLIELGRGGMAELFLARLHGAGGFAKLVAIKRILPHLAGDAQFKEMFLNEGRIAANLSHPNVCQVFELDEVDDELFLAMEYLEGVSWDHLSRELKRGTFAMRLALGVMAQACEGLHCAHMLRDHEGNPTPIAHRDVSPQNLFVTVDGVCKVLDFGVSKVMTDGPRTQSGVIKGKLPYMAPEQIRGEPVDGRADIFSLAVCLWEALTAERLFDRSTDFLIWKAITEEDAPSITKHWPECPPALDAAVLRALDRDRDKRPATARDFADALRAASTTPPCTPAEIAQAVKTRCEERLLERKRKVATALSARKDVRDSDLAIAQERDVATTLELRQESVTLDLRAEARRIDAADSVSETRALRREATDVRPRLAPEQIDDDEDRAPSRERRHLKTTIIVAMVAAAVTATVVVSVMMMGQDREPAAPPPAAPALPAPALPAPVVAPPPDAALVVAPEVDAAPAAPAAAERPQPPRALKKPRSKPAPPSLSKPMPRVDPFESLRPADSSPPPAPAGDPSPESVR